MLTDKAVSDFVGHALATLAKQKRADLPLAASDTTSQLGLSKPAIKDVLDHLLPVHFRVSLVRFSPCYRICVMTATAKAVMIYTTIAL